MFDYKKHREEWRKKVSACETKADHQALAEEHRHLLEALNESDLKEPTIPRPIPVAFQLMAAARIAVCTDGCTVAGPYDFCEHGHATWIIHRLIRSRVAREKADA